MRPFRHSLLGWTVTGGIVGGIIPALAAVYYVGFHAIAGMELLVVWPSSFGLMAIQPWTPWGTVIAIWMVCAIVNIALYSFVAATLYGIYRLLGRGAA